MDAAPWLRRVDARAQTRLLCLPFAGSGTVDFRSWRDGLPGHVDLCPIVLPGRESRLRDPAIDRMEPLVDALVDALLPVLRSAPYVIYGHSMGAWVGFEWVRALRRRHAPLPRHLVVGARRAPDRPARRPPLSGLAGEPFIAGVQERYGGIPQAIRDNAELMGLFVPTLRADFALLDGYTHRPEPALPMPITALRGRSDDTVVAADIIAWGSHTDGTFVHRTLPGGHFFHQDDPDLVLDVLTPLLRP